jgi:MFS family permease
MIAPATVALAAQLAVPVKHVAVLSGYQLLVVGALGPIVSILAQKFGKRPQFIFASFFGVIGTGICIAGFDQSDLKSSYRVLLAGRIVQGIGTTAYESLSVAAIGDLFFLHERGLRTALLVLTLACLSSLVSIIGGTLFENLGARNLFVVLLPIQIFGLLGAFFFLPESQFGRGEEVNVSGSQILDGEEREKDGAQDTTTTTESRVTVDGGNVAARRGFVQELRLVSGVTYTQTSVFQLFAEIFIHLLNPAVIWVQLVSAVLVVRPPP